jgi:hypothetical protein
MERRSFVRQAGLAGVLAAGAAPAVVHAQANVRWRAGADAPPDRRLIGARIIADWTISIPTGETGRGIRT